MIVGIGIDIVDLADFAGRLQQPGFIRKVFSAAEIELCEQYAAPAEHYAGKFAAKEATMKALGAGIRQGVWFTQIEVLNETSGRPFVRLQGAGARRAEALGAGTIHATLSHTLGLAVAVVILER